MTNSTPNASKAYVMIIQRESQRAISNVSIMNESSKATAFMTTKRGSFQGNFQGQNHKPRKTGIYIVIFAK